MRKISLVQLEANHKGKVAEILDSGNLQNKLMNMGVYKGKELTKLSHIGLRAARLAMCFA